MGGFHAEATIDRPVADVWATLTDWSGLARWMAGIDEVRADGPTTAGTTLTFRSRGKDRTSTLLDVVDGTSVTLRSTQGGVTADYRYVLSPSPSSDGGAGGTRATLDAECTATGLFRPLQGIIGRAMARADGGQMDALKALVESG